MAPGNEPVKFKLDTAAEETRRKSVKRSNGELVGTVLKFQCLQISPWKHRQGTMRKLVPSIDRRVTPHVFLGAYLVVTRI